MMHNAKHSYGTYQDSIDNSCAPAVIIINSIFTDNSGAIPKTPDDSRPADDDKKTKRKGKKNLQAEDFKINRERLKQLKEERRAQV